MRYAHGHYLCPRCLAQVAQVTGERRPTQCTVSTRPAAPHTQQVCYVDDKAGARVAVWFSVWQSMVKQKTFPHLPLPLPDRRDGYGPPPRAQALFAAETASYARSSGVIPCTKPHHYTGNIEAWAAKGYTGATLLQGDSRELCKIIQAHAGLLVSSSPYAASLNSERNGIDWSKTHHGSVEKKHGQLPHSSHATGIMAYGTHPDNLGSLPPGSLDAALAPETAAPPQLDLLVSSSPYADGGVRKGGNDPHPERTVTRQVGQSTSQDYGAASANLANLPSGALDAALAPGAALVACSPPDADGCTHTGGADPQPQHVQGGILRYVQYGVELVASSPPFADTFHGQSEATTPANRTQRFPHWRTGHQSQLNHPRGYGDSPAQFGTMPPGSVAAVVQGDLGVASPPFENSVSANGHGIDWSKAGQATGNRKRGAGSKHEATLRAQLKYSDTPEQLGNTQGTTFWEAAKQIISETYKILRPGAHAVWVCKNYVRNGEIVPFSIDWAKLCMAVGFEWIHHHKALLVETHSTGRNFQGEETTHTIRRESFFRRLSREKTGVSIDHEDILCFRKGL
jgi:hypothetical protein